MQAIDNKTSTKNDYVPKDYEDLYNYYIKGDGRGNSLCSQILRTMLRHGTEEEFATLPTEVYLRIMETKQLDVFDPSKGNFGGVIYYVTRTIVGNYLGRKERDPLGVLYGGSVTETDSEDGDFEPGVYCLDRLFGGNESDPGKKMDTHNIVTQLMNWASSLAEDPKNTRDRNLLKVIQLMAEENTPKEIAESLGFTPSTITNWIGIIRARLSQIAAA